MLYITLLLLPVKSENLATLRAKPLLDLEMTPLRESKCFREFRKFNFQSYVYMVKKYLTP